jgi:hypothetical protein
MSAGASTQAQQGFLIGLLRNLGGIANSPQKRVLIAAIVAILIVGIKNARQKGPQNINSKDNKRNVSFSIATVVLTPPCCFGAEQRQRKR